MDLDKLQFEVHSGRGLVAREMLRFSAKLIKSLSARTYNNIHFINHFRTYS